MRRRLCSLLLLAACSRGDRPFPYLSYGGRTTDGAQSFSAMPKVVLRAAQVAPRTRRQLDAIPAELTASDGTGLALERLRARGVVEGPLAFTEIAFTFRNPTDRRLEGRFQLALPPGAAVSRFAMKIRGAWMEAEVVERLRAQQVYESHLHRGVDPALLEHEAGSRFSARVFPIEAGEAKEILISYSHELVSPDQPYRLPLVGLPRLDRLEIAVRVGDRLVRRAERSIVPVRDFEVPVPRGRAEGLRAGDLIVARIGPELTAAPDPLHDLLVLLDTSASVGRALPDRVDDVAALARALASVRGPDFRLAVAAFDQTHEAIFEGRAADPAARYIQPLLLRRALGASDLEGALSWAGRAGYRRVLLVSDGIPTAGARDVVALARALGGRIDRLDVLAPAGTGDPALLAALAARGGRRAGVVIESGTAREQVARLERAASPPIEVSVDGAEWVWPRRLEGLQPGDHALVYARVARRPVRVHLRTGEHLSTRTLSLVQASRPLVEREAAQADMERRWQLLAETPREKTARRAELQREITDLSMRHRVLGPLTALIVLESESDYARFGLDRRALSDLLAVDATGLRVLRRGGLAPLSQPAITITPASTLNSGSGVLIGVVRDRSNGEPVAGVTVVATSPSLQGSQTAITDQTGRYSIPNLPPGRYDLTIYYSDFTVRRTAIAVHGRRTTTVGFTVDTSRARGETIEIKGEAPAIDSTATRQGATLTQDHQRNIPTGRTFENALGAAAGSQGDSLGVSFSGSTSLENIYVVDGVNTSGASEKPPSPLAYSGRMLVVMRQLERRELDAALAEALDWRTDAPWDLMALVALGEALEARGSLTLAARAYGSIVDEMPSRADLRRFAAGRLARLGPVASNLLVDCLERAVELRPDHPSGHRMLAYAHLRAGRHRRALDILLAALDRTDDQRRFERARPLLIEDAGLVAAAYLVREPARRRDIQALLDRHGVLVPMEPSVHFVLTWENDATDLDLHVARADQPFSPSVPRDAEPGPDVTDGFGPEHAAVRGAVTEGGYHLWVDYENRNMMGTGLGQLHILEHDGAGRLRTETRPFVVMNERATVDLGAYRPRAQPPR